MKTEYITISRSKFNSLLLFWFYCGCLLSLAVLSFILDLSLVTSMLLILLLIVSLSLSIYYTISIQIYKPIKLPDNPKTIISTKPKKNFGYRPK